MGLDKQISTLLLHYDCVIIPEFGGFITNYKPAHLDQRLHIFHPPSKEVSFNQNLKRNDGLLANYLSDIHSCSFEEANAIIRAEVEAYFTLLNNGERVVFEKVGILYRDRDENLRFQPAHEQNFLKDAFGLEKLFAAPLASAASTEAEDTRQPEEANPTPVIPMPAADARDEAPESAAEEAAPQRRWPVRTAWAATLFLPVLAYGAWLLATTDVSKPQHLTIADLNPFRGDVAATYASRTAANPWVTEEKGEDRITQQLKSDADAVEVSFTDPPGEGIAVRLKAAPKPAIAVNTYVATPDILSMRYHVVGGCFSELSNARGWVDELRSRGYNAFILDQHNGLYRVTFGNFDRRSLAVSALRKIKQEELAGAWLLVK